MSVLDTRINGPVTLMFGIGFVLGIAIEASTGSTDLFFTPPLHGSLPHQISKFPGGIALRFAMVDDVLHERFPMHGPDYYTHRNSEVLGELAKASSTQPADEARMNLMDDLAVGYVHLGQYQQALQVLQDKLKQQESLNLSGRPLYSTYANIGTSMMIESLGALLGRGDPSARQELQDSLQWVQKSIGVNPEAHFGREIWQVKLGQFLLRAFDRPGILGETDFIGNDLTGNALRSSSPNERGSAAMIGMPRWSMQVTEAMGNPKMSDERRAQLRRWIVPIATGVPFDEPTLAIIGMWRYGAGANAHFSLALGETMLRVGQRYIAWDAFERAARLADGFWPDPQVQAQFLEHCRNRQAEIETTLHDVTTQQLRTAFDAELKKGLDYQHAYKQYESDRLARGARSDDPHFYNNFLTEHGHIASDPGLADEIFVVPDGAARLSTPLPAGIFGGGLGAFATAMIIRWRRRVTN